MPCSEELLHDDEDSRREKGCQKAEDQGFIMQEIHQVKSIWEYRDNGKEHGNYYSILGYLLGSIIWILLLRPGLQFGSSKVNILGMYPPSCSH